MLRFQERRFVLEALEERCLLAIALYGNGGESFSYLNAFTGVGLALNPVAEINGSYNGKIDDKPSDYSAQIEWGDGGSSDAMLTTDPADGYVLVKGSHIYGAMGTYSVTVDVTGPGGQTASATTCEVTVTDMPDEASIPPDVPTSYSGAQSLGAISLGLYGAGAESFSYLSAFTGVGFSLNPVAEVNGYYNDFPDRTLGNYHAQINWGDSPTWDTDTALAIDPATNYLLVKGSHNYQQTGSYDVTVYITGPDGQSASATTCNVTVSPLPEAASIPPDVPKSDPGAQSLGAVSLGLYGAGAESFSYLSAFTGVGFSLNPVAEVNGYYNDFSDQTLSDYHAQINWGDSQSWDTNTALALDPATGYVLVKGSHNYLATGKYDVTVYITGPDGQTASATTCQVTVTPMPDAASIPPDVPKSYSGSQNLGAVSLGLYGAGAESFSYLGAITGVGFSLNPVAEVNGYYNDMNDATLSDYHAQINWGDSQSWDTNTALALDPATGYLLVKGSHNYQETGKYDVTVYITGPDGQSASATTCQVTVNPMPDAASIPPDVPKSEPSAQALGAVSLGLYGAGAESFSYLSAFTGVGFSLNPVAEVDGYYNDFPDRTLGDYHAQINWGDSPIWDADTALALDPATDYVLVKGSHNYQQTGTYDVTVYITGPDGQTASATTCQVTVTPMPDAASIPPDVPTSYSGVQPVGALSLVLYGAGAESLSYLSAFTGVAFSESPVAEVNGYYNDSQDKTLSDYHAQINWGDSPAWDTNTELALDSLTGYVEVFGSHAYQKVGDYDVTVYVTGPDGQTASVTTSEVTVAANPLSATLSAVDVGDANAPSETPYNFTITFQDNGGLISSRSVSGTTVQVVPPGSTAITATLVSTQLSGTADNDGDASTITANYQITPPGGSWTGAPIGIYSVNLAGTPVTGVSGGEAPQGAVGTFQVSVADQLKLEVATLDESVPEDGTIQLELQAFGPSGKADPGVNGPATIDMNGSPVATVNLQGGSGTATITAPAQPGQYLLKGYLSNLGSDTASVNVEPEQPSDDNLFNEAAKGAAKLAELLKSLIEEDLKDPNQVAQVALKDLEGLKNILGKVIPILNFLPLANDLRSLWKDATAPANAQNQLQFERDFSSALKEGIDLDVAWGVTVGLKLNPIGAIGGFLLGSAIEASADAVYDNFLKAGAMTTAGQLYQSLKGSGSTVLLKGGVQYFPGNGDPPPSIIVVNPPNASSGAENLSIAGQSIYAQSGTSFNGVVATFVDASGNTNLSNYNAYIAWGDGNFTQGTVAALPGGGFEVTGIDTYITTGIYSVSVIVTSTDGSSASSYAAATVYPAGPSGATSAPVLSLLAPQISSENADWSSPYSFSVVYQDAAMASFASLAGSTVEVQPPTGSTITATEVGTQVLGNTDLEGDGTTLIVTYEITPPGGSWYAAPQGTYTVLLGGMPVTDVSGHAVALGSAGTFDVSVPPTLAVSPVVGTDPSTEASVSNTASLALTGYAEAGSTVTIEKGSANLGTTQAGVDGSWSYTYQAPDDGSYDFSVFDTDSHGNTSPSSPDFPIEVDTVTPTSTVTALPSTTSATSFTVSWSGSESTVGTGVAVYDVYVSDDGGPFMLFQSDTTETSATFAGQAGHTYQFYSVAIDYAGNTQATPTAPQATITVLNTPPPPPPPPAPPAPPAHVTVGSPQVETIKLGTGKRAKPETVIVLDFSAGVSAGAASNAGAYELAPIIKVPAKGKGKNRKPATTKLGAAVPVASAVYNSSNDSVMLTLRGKLIASKPEELMVNGALITDTFGREIDGAGDGQPGSDFTATVVGTHVSTGGIPLAQTQRRQARVSDVVDHLLAHGDLRR